LIYYIDSAWGGPFNGTEEEPYNDPSQLPALVGSDTVLLKRGSQFLLSTPWAIQTANNITVDAYGSGDLPILEYYQVNNTAGDWTEIATDVWELDTGDPDNAGIAKYMTVGLGTLGVFGDRVDYNQTNPTTVHDFTEYGQQSFTFGNGADNAKLLIYASQNPVTEYGPIYYVLASQGTLEFKTVNGIARNIRFQWSGAGYRLSASSGSPSYLTPIVTDCEIHGCVNGIFLTSDNVTEFRDVHIARNTITDSHNAGVYARRAVMTGSIEYNQIINSGLSISGGVIYHEATDGTPGNPFAIRNNFIDGMTYGKYFPTDGAGIYQDVDLGNWFDVSYNTITNMDTTSDKGPAFHINAGVSNCRYWGNIVDTAAVGFRLSRNLDLGTFDLLVDANLFLNVNNGWIVTNKVNAGDGNISFRNNIFSGVDAVGGVGAFRGSGLTSDPYGDYNCYFRFPQVYSDITPGANDVLDDPKLNGYRISQNSPCYKVGDNAILPLQDRTGEFFTAPPNMGAFSSSYDGVSTMGYIGFSPSDLGFNTTESILIANDKAMAVHQTRVSVVPPNAAIYEVGARMTYNSTATRNIEVGVYPSVAGNPVGQSPVASAAISYSIAAGEEDVLQTVKAAIDPPFVVPAEGEYSVVICAGDIGNAKFANAFSVTGLENCPRDTALVPVGALPDPFESDALPAAFEPVIWAQYSVQVQSKDPLVTDSHFTLSRSGGKKDVVQGTTAPTVTATDMAIYLSGAPLNVRQSIVGTLKVFKRYLLNQLNTLQGSVATVVLSGPIGVSNAGVVVDGVPGAADLRLHIGTDFLVNQRSQAIEETFNQLVAAFLEASTGN